MMVGDTMLIPIAPAGAGAAEGAPIGDMLRRSAGADRWLGLALRVADLKEADPWFRARGFKLHYDPGMENHYFLVGRGQAMGVRLELLQGDLPGDPRIVEGWSPAKWRDDHPLGIEGLQAIGVSAPSVEEARDLFARRLELADLGQRHVAIDDADCAAFVLGDTVIEALVPRGADSPLARHVAAVKGICNITFKVRDAQAAVDYLRSKGLDVVGDVDDRFGLRPEQAFGRTIRFTQNEVPGYPQPGSLMRYPARFPAAGVV